MPTPVIAIFDIGKTNKKVFLFNQQYRLEYEASVQFNEIQDEDGCNCEDLDKLRTWLLDTLNQVLQLADYHILAINFATYGASFVYLNNQGEPLTPLYNYLKPYNTTLLQQFYATYGGQEAMALATASPVLGSLNSGMQLYRLKYEQPAVFAQTQSALHLPQYLHYLLTKQLCTDITSIGCHTGLWHFELQQYHYWVLNEQILPKLPPLVPSSTTYKGEYQMQTIQIGVGLHDSSAALIPYLKSFSKPFVLLSTGTWCISLNPFNATTLTASELAKDCLLFYTYQEQRVKASRLFSGHELTLQSQLIAQHFGEDAADYQHMPYQPAIVEQLLLQNTAQPLPILTKNDNGLAQSAFGLRALSQFVSSTYAYHQLLIDLVNLQQWATQLVIQNSGVEQLYVDGGFGNNVIFMHLLAKAFPQLQVFAASIPQATALGAALAIHPSWNNQPIATNLVTLQPYSTSIFNTEL